MSAAEQIEKPWVPGDPVPADSPPTVHERMVAILTALPPIGKNQKNTQQNFMFRGHDDVLNALNPLLAKHGVFVVPDVLERVTSQRTTSKGSIMFEVNLHVRYSFFGAAGDSVAASAWGEGTDMGDKATNKAMTMAFKNVLNQAFAISTEEMRDADADTPEHSQTSEGEPRAAGSASVGNGAAGENPASPSDNVISEAQLRRMWTIWRETKLPDQVLKDLVERVAGVESTKAIPRDKYDALIAEIEKVNDTPF